MLRYWPEFLERLDRRRKTDYNERSHLSAFISQHTRHLLRGSADFEIHASRNPEKLSKTFPWFSTKSSLSDSSIIILSEDSEGRILFKIVTV